MYAHYFGDKLKFVKIFVFFFVCCMFCSLSYLFSDECHINNFFCYCFAFVEILQNLYLFINFFFVKKIMAKSSFCLLLVVVCLNVVILFVCDILPLKQLNVNHNMHPKWMMSVYDVFDDGDENDEK